jgi:hypothetical protein
MAPVGSIVVSRDMAAWRDRARKYKLLVDGSVVGRLAQGEVFTHPVEPGVHSVQMKIDWGSSPKVECSVKADRSVHLVCGPAGRAFSGDILFRPGRYVRLEEST